MRPPSFLCAFLCAFLCVCLCVFLCVFCTFLDDRHIFAEFTGYWIKFAFPMATIGIFDSGAGGLSVFREIFRILPGENYIYWSDNAFCPYGDKPREFIVDRARTITRGGHHRRRLQYCHRCGNQCPQGGISRKIHRNGTCRQARCCNHPHGSSRCPRHGRDSCRTEIPSCPVPSCTRSEGRRACRPRLRGARRERRHIRTAGRGRSISQPSAPS